MRDVERDSIELHTSHSLEQNLSSCLPRHFIFSGL